MKSAAVAGIGLGLAVQGLPALGKDKTKGKRVGIIGLDTSHSISFTKELNKANAGQEYSGYRVVAAYPQGSADIESSAKRIPGYIEEVKKQGVKIVDSIKALLKEVYVLLLETNDGRPRLEQERDPEGVPVERDRPVDVAHAHVDLSEGPQSFERHRSCLPARPYEPHTTAGRTAFVSPTAATVAACGRWRRSSPG